MTHPPDIRPLHLLRQGVPWIVVLVALLLVYTEGLQWGTVELLENRSMWFECV